MFPHSRIAHRIAVASLAVVLVAGCADGSDGSDLLAEVDPQPTAVQPRPTPSPTATALPEATEEALDFSFLDDAKADGKKKANPTPTPRPITGPSRWWYRALLGSLNPSERVVPRVAPPVEAVPGAAPLTGLPAASPLPRAVIVKIDNTNAARPHAGINQADIVYEEMVESGITRLAAVFHSQAVGPVGPVRSGRSTDIAIIDSFRRPVFANSGANSIFDGLLDKQPIINRGAELFRGYWRDNSRPAPHNLFTSTESLLSGIDASTPRAHFAYRKTGHLRPKAKPATSVALHYSKSSAPVEYTWDAARGGWRRWQSGTAHVDTAGVQVAPENVIVQFIDYVDTGMSDKFGSVIVEGSAIGAGKAWIFSDGRRVVGTWTKSNLKSATTFTDGSDKHIALTPGRTWVALVPVGGADWE